MSSATKRQQQRLFQCSPQGSRGVVQKTIERRPCIAKDGSIFASAFGAKANKIHGVFRRRGVKHKVGLLKRRKNRRKNDVLKLAVEKKKKKKRKMEPAAVVATAPADEKNYALCGKNGKGGGCSRGAKREGGASKVRNLLRRFSRE